MGISTKLSPNHLGEQLIELASIKHLPAKVEVQSNFGGISRIRRENQAAQKRIPAAHTADHVNRGRRSSTRRPFLHRTAIGNPRAGSL